MAPSGILKRQVRRAISFRVGLVLRMAAKIENRGLLASDG